MKQNQSLRTPRLVSLDVFRGITIALMIIVNSPGNPFPYHVLAHSVWNGCTLADLVFPFFIVILGMSSVLALSNLRAKSVSTSTILFKIIKRSAYIFLMGLMLNAFPHHFDWSSIRLLGVLQRIAICYFAASILFLTTRICTQGILALVVLIGYACLMTATGSLSLDGNIAGYVDRLVFSAGHLYTPSFDPEGLLSTLPAIVSAVLGNLIGSYLMTSQTKLKKVAGMLLSGLLLALAGWFWAYSLPMNKALWSSSYVLWTGGLALLLYALIYALIEIKQWTRWSIPFDLFGRHAMLVYVLHILFLKIQAMVHVHTALGTVVHLRLYITETLFGNWRPENAALFYALGYTILWLFVLAVIEKWRQLLMQPTLTKHVLFQCLANMLHFKKKIKM